MLGSKSKLALVVGRHQMRHIKADVSHGRRATSSRPKCVRRRSSNSGSLLACIAAMSARNSEFTRAMPLLSEAVGLDVLSAKGLPEVLVSDLFATF